MTSNYGNVNFTGYYGGQYYYSPNDIENLTKYATGVAITQQDELSLGSVASGAGSQLLVEGGSWLWGNRGHYKEALTSMADTSKAMHDVYVSGKTAGGFVNGIKSVSNATSANQLLKMMPNPEALGQMSSNTQALYNNAKLAAEAAKGGSKEAISKASQLFSEANAASYAEKAANATGWWGKTKNAIGITKAGNAINNLAVKSPTFGKCLNTFKAQGGPMMLVMEGATEAITNVYPTFKQLGAKAGMKQVGKSAVKTVASVGGWVAGAAIGTKVGAAIGSIIPGAGTAVGAAAGAIIGSVCSLLGGIFGSKLAKKGAEKVVGKDELVLAQEKQAKELAQAATVDKTVLNQVVNVASERLNEEGVSSDDALIAYNSLNALSNGSRAVATGTTNPFLRQAV